MCYEVKTTWEKGREAAGRGGVMEKGNEEGGQFRTKCSDIYMYICTHINTHTHTIRIITLNANLQN